MGRTSCEGARFQVKNNFKVATGKKIAIWIHHLCLLPHHSNCGSAIFNLTKVKTVFPHVCVVQDHFVLDGQSSNDFNGNLMLCWRRPKVRSFKGCFPPYRVEAGGQRSDLTTKQRRSKHCFSSSSLAFTFQFSTKTGSTETNYIIEYTIAVLLLAVTPCSHLNVVLASLCTTPNEERRAVAGRVQK